MSVIVVLLLLSVAFCSPDSESPSEELAQIRKDESAEKAAREEHLHFCRHQAQTTEDCESCSSTKRCYDIVCSSGVYSDEPTIFAPYSQFHCECAFVAEGRWDCSRGGNFESADKRNEDSYVQEWCAKNGGDAEFRLSDGAIVDCLLPDFAVEFDWGEGSKVYDCIGQALFYGTETERMPVCILIQKSGQEDESFYRHAHRAVVAGESSSVIVRCIDAAGREKKCKE